MMESLSKWSEKINPDMAGSVCEGMEETLANTPSYRPSSPACAEGFTIIFVLNHNNSNMDDKGEAWQIKKTSIQCPLKD